MKKFLLFAAAALMVTTAGAQLKSAVPHSKAADAKQRLSKLTDHSPAQQLNVKDFSSIKEMKMGKSSTTMNTSFNAPKKATYLESFYKRPAGMFCSPFIMAEGGKGLYSYGNLAFLMNKPFAPYTWTGTIEGADENTHCAWDFWIQQKYYGIDDEYELTYEDYFSADKAPIFYAVDGPLSDKNSTWYGYQMKSYNDDGTPIALNVLSIYASEQYEEDMDFMYSSKTMVNNGLFGNQEGMITRYYGATPWGENQYGWWFGKNGQHIDGMAMAFEKPQQPYLLKKVYLQAYTDMVVNAPVTMTCKVYKLDQIPEYIKDNTTQASLPATPGELICTGKATVTPTTGADKNGLIEFTLYGYDEEDPDLVYEYRPTVDYPILVVCDNYNDEGMEDLVDFSAFVCVDDQVDEGYGELAYLKVGTYEYELDEEGDTVYDEEGNPVQYFTGEYVWKGLNNQFLARDDESWPEKKATMMTGLTLFLGTENPFLTFNHGLEDGEYTFPDEGGDLVKTFEYSDTTIVSEGIQFFTMTPSDDWDILYNGDDELPEWLEIELVDEYDETDEFTGLVTAKVTAAPLPEGIGHREAVLRFRIPGDYCEYKFMQGENIPIPGDVDGNGEVNIADVNCVIGVIQGKPDIYEGRADVDGNDEVNIADVNAIISIILQ